MFRYFLIVSLLTIVGLINPINIKHAQAIYDPLSVPNNKIGIHILFPDEIDKAKELINSNGGDWGYVVIPIRSDDKDLEKWQKFMDRAAELHIIPIIRIATHGDFFELSSWKKPQDADILDFANFLDSLDWPVKNRYVIIFNEVNRSDEWEGEANPGEYARLLSYAVIVFKAKNPDYFIISAGLDNAAETDGETYNQFDFLRSMNQEVAGIFNQIDGISSHSYPNPAFSQPPSVLTPKSISSFQYEISYIRKFTNKSLPVFITETGWDQTKFSDQAISNFFKEALYGVWSDPSVVTVSPFLLKAGAGPFEKFSFIKDRDIENGIYRSFLEIPKTKGIPGESTRSAILGNVQVDIPIKDFSDSNKKNNDKSIKKVIKWFILGF